MIISYPIRLLAILLCSTFFHGTGHAQSMNPALASGFLQNLPGANPLGNTPGASPIDAKMLRDLTGSPAADALAEKQKTASSTEKLADLEEKSLKINAPNQPNAFQTFIIQSTGKSLPIYGQSLFNRSNPYSTIEVANVSSDYVLGPGDELLVKVFSSSFDVDQRFVINREGMIVLPKIGPISLAGTKVSALEARLKNELSQTLTDFNLYVSMGQLRGIEIYVTGQARSPGKHNLSSVSTLINALFATGGPTSNGSMRNIQLLRGGKVVTTVDLYDFLSKGNSAMDVRLLPGDVVNIPPIGQQVALMGVIPTPSVFELSSKRANALQEVIQLAGGLSALNLPNKAILERIENGTKDPLKAFSLDLRESAKFLLRDGDMVTLLPINPSFSNAVSLRILNNTVRLPIEGSSKIADLIPNKSALITPDYFYRRFNVRIVPSAEANPGGSFSGSNSSNDLERIANNALSDQFNLESVMIERTLAQSLNPQVIVINLQIAWADRNSEQNISLQPGDVITVYSQKDIQVPTARLTNIVRIQGEVNAPGIYQMQGGETLAELMTKAGGWTDKAYLYGMQVSRQSIRETQKKNIEVAIKNLEVQIAVEGSQAFSSLNLNPQEQQTQGLLRAQNQARVKEKINQLRTSVPSGRLVLELDPRRIQIPDLVLEQGDQIVIPTTPSSISVVGAVYNENALIYRAERTVKEYLKAAGVTPNADLEATFIVRADGSLVAPEAKTSFFSSAVQVDDERLMPGDLVFVPEKIIKETRYSAFVRGLRDWTQILYQFGLGVAGIKVLRD